jgi:hypothetical protein
MAIDSLGALLSQAKFQSERKKSCFWIKMDHKMSEKMRHVLIDNFHDTELCAIDVRRFPELVTLTFKISDNNFRQLELNNCKDFRLVDLKRQNIVSRILIISGTEIDKDFVKNQVDWVSRHVDTTSSVSNDEFEKLFRQIWDGKLTVFSLVPSVGAECVAICESVLEGVTRTPVATIEDPILARKSQ